MKQMMYPTGNFKEAYRQLILLKTTDSVCIVTKYNENRIGDNRS